MQEWITTLMNQFGYAGILFLIAFENIFPPIPSEVILTFGGFMTTYTQMTVWGVIIWSTIGSLLGGMILYGIGRWLDQEKMFKIVEGPIGKILRLNKQDIEKSEKWFQTKGKMTVFICRFIPILRSLISIPAGMVKMPIHLFLILTTLGTAIWNTILVYVGSLMGEHWIDVVSFIKKYSLICVGIFIIVIAIYIFYKNRLGKQKKQ